MLKYFIKRFLSIIPKILVISVLIFIGMQLIDVYKRQDELLGLLDELIFAPAALHVQRVDHLLAGAL